METQTQPAIPPFEQASLPDTVNESGRRILWIVGIYRAVCGTLLVGIALFLDLRVARVGLPNAFLTATGLYFIFGLLAFLWIQRESLLIPLPALLLTLLIGDIFFISLLMYSGGSASGPLPILLFPQLAASGWLLRSRLAFFHAALASSVLIAVDSWRLIDGLIPSPQILQTGLIGFGYFATVGVALALGSYTRASEELAAQRGIDVANLEQVNRLIIQDMQDGVLVVDLNGVVRGHNAQVTRLLGGFGRMRGACACGIQLGTARLLATLAGRFRGTAAAVQGGVDTAAVARPAGAHRSGLNGGTLIYLEDLGRAGEAQQIKLAAMGRLTASIAHEVRNPLSAINQAAQLLEEDGSVAPEGQRLLSMIRNNAKPSTASSARSSSLIDETASNPKSSCTTSSSTR